MKIAVFFFFALSLAAPWQRAEAIGRMENGDGSMALAHWAGNSQGQISSGTNSGTGYSLYTSVGEAAFSRASAGSYAVNPGYIKLAAQPGSLTVITSTAVTKSTGTLELYWTAPGADGFLGDVVNGSYRLDYSSDSAHSFSPTVYVSSFSTTVVANMPQQYTIPGLQPNTTYYTKIYLGDSGNVIAEKSALSSESTLADLPVNPRVSTVTPCSVTISWDMPGTGSEGFGIFHPGDSEVKTSSSQLSLTINDLLPAHTYIIRVANLNWQGEHGASPFMALITAVTPPGTCLPPVTLISTIGHPMRDRSITLTWINPNPSTSSLQGVIVMLSTSNTPSGLDGTEYSGQTLADGSVVKSTDAVPGAVKSLLDTTGFTTSLALNTTYFYHLLAKYNGPMYSVAVSTSVFLDLPPMAPAGLIAKRVPGAVELNWQPVKSSLDGTPFLSTSSTMVEELSHYRIDKSSSVGAPNWIPIEPNLSIYASSFTAVVASTDPFYIYRISAIDSYNTHDSAMAVDTNRNMYVFSDDPAPVAMLKIPYSISDEMQLANNAPRSNILIRATHIKGPYASADILNAVSYDAVKTPGNEPLPNYKFSRPELTVSVRYNVSGGQVVPSAAAPQAISAGDAAQRLGLYWNNNENYVKFYGNVDIINQLVSAQTAMTGQYQVRAVYREAGVHFDISQLSSRVITPNGDGRNDLAIFIFDNPKDSAYSGKIFDISGAFVADMTEGPSAKKSLQWDGKAGGRPVASGAYVYQIKAEGKTFNGTLLVIR